MITSLSAPSLHTDTPSIRNNNLLRHVPLPLTTRPRTPPYQVLKHPPSHILPTNRIPHRRPFLRPRSNLLFPQRLPIRQQARPHNHVTVRQLLDRLFHVPLVAVRVREEVVVERGEEEGDVAGAVGDAGCGERDEEGFGICAGGREGREGGEDVCGGGGADGDFGAGGGDADAGDYDVGGAAVEGQGFLAVVGVEDVALGDGEVGFDGGRGDAFFEKEGGELGWVTDD